MRCVAASDPDSGPCVPGRLRRGACERHYRRLMRHGTSADPARRDNLTMYRVDPATGCWVWQGALWPNGYGKTSVPVHGTQIAHRAFFIEHHGAAPDGMDVDHTCHNADPDCRGGVRCRHKRCCNPAHLRLASHAENLLAAIRSRAYCQAGHDLTQPGALWKPERGARTCAECLRSKWAKSRARVKDALRT